MEQSETAVEQPAAPEEPAEPSDAAQPTPLAEGPTEPAEPSDAASAKPAAQPLAEGPAEPSAASAKPAEEPDVTEYLNSATTFTEVIAEYLAQDRDAVMVSKINLLQNEMQLHQTALRRRVQSAADAASAVCSLAETCSIAYKQQCLAQAAALQALHSLTCSTSRVEALGTSAAQASAEATVAKIRQFHLQKAALHRALQSPQSDLTPLNDQLFAEMSEACGTSKRAAALSAAAACGTCTQLADQRAALSALATLHALRRDANTKYELFAESSERLAELHRGVQGDLDKALVTMQRSIESVTNLSGEAGVETYALATESSYSLCRTPRSNSGGTSPC
jgi:hypothetical protein